MNSELISDLRISTLASLYASGAAQPEDVVNFVYDRLESAPLLPVWIDLFPRTEALARARQLKLSKAGPLYGIPFAVKDNIDVAGLPTTAACPAYSFIPEANAFVVQKLMDAGAIPIGKTNLDQFATGLVGTRSPYGACSSVFDKEYISGGSSSGSAVAVAGGLVTFSLGTDTAGSGRIPAAFNNIVGLKPSRGLLSTSGVVPACRSLDCVSVFALNPADAAAVFEIARAIDPGDAYSRIWPATPPPIPDRYQIGYPKEHQLKFFGDSRYQQLYSETLEFLRKAEGAELLEIDFTPFQQVAELLYGGPFVAERFAAVGDFVRTHQDDIDPIVGTIIAGSERFTAADAFLAQYRLEALRRETGRVWQHIDALLLPTAPTTYTIERIQKDPIRLNSNLGYYTNFVNLLDLCAVAVPAGFTTSSLPFGVSLVAPAFSEYALLELAARIQQGRASFSGARVAPVPESPYVTPAANNGRVLIGVVGAHLLGQPLNRQLTDRGATLVRTTVTATDYQFFALTNTTPVKPGLVRVPGFHGPGIEIEIWTMPQSEFGSFVAAVPSPLSIGTCTLKDGTSVKGFLCEPYAAQGMPEITQLGSWRKYLQTQ